MIIATVDQNVVISAEVKDVKGDVLSDLKNLETWSIDDATIATGVASADGLSFTVTALKAGVATITFTDGVATGTSVVAFHSGAASQVTLTEAIQSTAAQ